MFELQHGRYSIDDLLDFDEIANVAASHRDAAQANAEEAAELAKLEREAGRR